MKVRLELFRWLTSLVLLATAVALFALSYGSAARQAALAAARAEADRRAGLEAGTLLAEINKFRILPYVLTELPDVGEALTAGSPAARARLNKTLRSLAGQTGASAIYAIDRSGIARAASNWQRPDSFVGHDFRFRPYFLRALRGGAAEYFAEGAVTGRPGLFLARRAGPADRPTGVIVVKIEFDTIERLWRAGGWVSFVLDPDGIVIVSTDPRLRYKVVGTPAPARLAQIRGSRQFGPLSLRPAPLHLAANGSVRDGDGTRYIATVRPLPLLGWRQVLLQPERPVRAAADARARFATLVVAIGLAAALAALAWVATRRRRQLAARAVLEREVERRTAELSDAYAELQREAAQREAADTRYRAAREELAQANRLGSIGTITTSVAHELNQPLAAIGTTAENAIKFLARDKPAQAIENLHLITALTQRIGAITGQLLSYARRGQRGAAEVGVDAAVDGALLLIGDTFRRAGVALQIERSYSAPRLRIAQIRLEQVLVNLLQNALDAVRDRPQPTVRLAVAVAPNEVSIIVADNGAGVPPALADQVFQPFFTSKPHGIGLGLGICREILHDYGGTLTMTPSPLGGAAFAIRLPAMANAA